jgi:zinc protease
MDVVRKPSFPAPALEALARNRARNIRQLSESLPYLLESAFYGLLYGDRPAARRFASAEAIEAISLDAVRRWHRERYVPENALLTFAGDVDATGLTAIVDASLVGWTGSASGPAPDPRATPPDASGREIVLVDRRGASQVGISVGNRTVRRDHPDYVPLRVANEILGSGGFDQPEYVAYSQFAASEFEGPWSLVAVTGVGSVTTAVDGLLATIRQLQDGPIPTGQLDLAKQSLVTSFALSLEDARSRATYASLVETYQLGETYWSDYLARVAEVDGADVQRVARRYLDLDSIRIAVVGDASAIQADLEAFGPVRLAGSGSEPAPG